MRACERHSCECRVSASLREIVGLLSLRVEHRALLREYRALLREYRALLRGYRALLQGYRALLQGYRALLQGYRALLQGYRALLRGRGLFCENRLILKVRLTNLLIHKSALCTRFALLPVRSQNDLMVPRKLIDVTNISISTGNWISKSVYTELFGGNTWLVCRNRLSGSAHERTCATEPFCAQEIS